MVRLLGEPVSPSMRKHFSFGDYAERVVQHTGAIHAGSPHDQQSSWYISAAPNASAYVFFFVGGTPSQMQPTYADQFRLIERSP